MFRQTLLISILLGCLQLSEAGKCDEWVECVNTIGAEALNLIENLTMLQIDTLPDDMAKLCPYGKSEKESGSFNERYPNATCQGLTCWDSELEQPEWEQRFQYAEYVSVLTWIGCNVVGLHPDMFLDLKNCYVKEKKLKESLLTCIDGLKYDTQCLIDKYNEKKQNCNGDVDKSFIFIVYEFFSSVPYHAH